MIRIAPRFEILLPEAVATPNSWAIRLDRGPGFGDGSHDTTILCLQGLAALAPRGRSFRLLDFGSGSGILSIAAAAHWGAHVDAVEIDARAIEHAKGNLLLNGVGHRVRLLRDLAETTGKYELIVANILRDVLLAHADALTERLDALGTLILSGLVSTDVPELGARYAARLDTRPEIYARDEWRALVFRRGSHVPPK